MGHAEKKGRGILLLVCCKCGKEATLPPRKRRREMNDKTRASGDNGLRYPGFWHGRRSVLRRDTVIEDKIGGGVVFHDDADGGVGAYADCG